MKDVTGMDFGVRFYRRRPQKKNVQKKQDLAEGIAMRLFKKSELKMIFTNRVIDYAQAKVVAKIDFAKLIAKKEVQTTQRVATKEKALWVAAQAGDSRAIRLLVMAGVDIDARDFQGRTALNIAMQYNQTGAIKTLLAAREMMRMSKLGELPSSIFYDKFRNNRQNGTK